MKKLLLAGLVLMFSIISKAQVDLNTPASGAINGKVVDSATGLPLEYASISIINANKQTVNGSTSNKNGMFTITGLASGSYSLVAEFVGYLPVTISNINLDRSHPLFDVNTIMLSKSHDMLQNVVVTGRGKLVENRIDKLVFNAERDISSQTGVATDILKKVPQVSVDVDGNVELAGSSNVRFLINGKPSTAFGSNIADVLQSIPASQIKSIEVVTNPGARYEAQGLGGIINIILKKNNARGINGNMSLSAGTRMDNGSLNLNARRDNFGVNAFISGNTRPKFNTPSTSDRTSFDSLATSATYLHQDGSRTVKRHGLQTGIGFDWTYKKRNSFSGSLNYDAFGNNTQGLIQQQQIEKDNSGNLLSQIASFSNSGNTYKSHNVDASLNYKRSFEKQDQELEISANTSTNNNLSTANTEQFLLPADSLYYGVRNSNPGRETETQFEINYAQPIQKKVIWGSGSKVTLFDISSNAQVLSLQPTSEYLFDKSLSNSLRYHQKVYAAYSEITFPVGKLFDAKIGGRYERTEINSFYSQAQKPEVRSGYNTFVPSIFFSKKIGETQTIKLSYSKRIQRPEYDDLNPFINTADPKNITAGNPALRPEISHRVELGYNHDIASSGSFMVNLFFRRNEGDIQPYIVYYPTLQVGDSVYTNVSVSTRQNIGIEDNTGVSVFTDLHFDKLGVRINGFFFHRHISNAIDPGLDARSFNYRFNLNTSYQFTSTFATEFFGNFNSPRNELQGKYPSFVTYSFAFRKQIWKKQGSIALTATNPFNQYVRQETKVFGPSFTLNSVRNIPFRSFGINFTWKFGRLEFKKDTKEDSNINLNPPSE